MSRPFIAFVTATAIALTSFTATPARADLTNAEKWVLGTGALLLLGIAIDEAQRDTKKKKKKRKVVHEPRVITQPTVTKPRHSGLAPLPRFCLRNVQSFEGTRRIFGQRCLRNNYAQVNRLPDRCRTFIQGPRGTRVGYAPRCLRRAGLRVSG